MSIKKVLQIYYHFKIHETKCFSISIIIFIFNLLQKYIIIIETMLVQSYLGKLNIFIYEFLKQVKVLRR